MKAVSHRYVANDARGPASHRPLGRHFYLLDGLRLIMILNKRMKFFYQEIVSLLQPVQ